MDALEPKLQELLGPYQQHFQISDNGKIECRLNGHTLPARYDAVASFIQGAKFQKLAKRQHADQALQKYEPFIVQSKNFPLMLYCALTGQLIDKSVEAVKQHMKGKKFQRAKDRFANDQLELKPEPSLESFGIKVAAAAGAEGAQQQQQEQEQGEEPEFWVPPDEADMSTDPDGAEGQEEEEEEEGVPGSSGSRSEEEDEEDEEAMNGVNGDAADAAEPMEEDTDAAAAAAEAGAKATSIKRSKQGSGVKAAAAAGKGQQHKRQQTAAAAGGRKTKPAAQNGGQGKQTAQAAEKKKQNVGRPSAAKKAKR